MGETLTQAELKKHLSYDPETGVFTRIVSAGRARAGEAAGAINSNGYRVIGVAGKRDFAHRLAFLWMTGALPHEQADHKNGNRDDNRWGNLRAVSKAENAKNKRIPDNNSSGVLGVSWNKLCKKWVAMIKIGAKYTYLGVFADKDDAINARKSAEAEHGYHGNHGRSA